MRHARLLMFVGVMTATSTSDGEATQSPLAEDAVRSVHRVAAKTALRQAIDELAGLRLDRLEQNWSDAMLADPVRYVTAAVSRERLAADFERRLIEQLDAMTDQIQRGFGGSGEKPWFSHAWLYEQRERDTVRITAQIRANRRNHFDAAFRKSRVAAVDRQSATLAAAAPPAAVRVEEMFASGWDAKTKARIAEITLREMIRGRILFEEVRAGAGTAAERAVGDARAQFEEQMAASNSQPPEGLKAAADIARALSAHVGNVRARRLRASGFTYDVFPSVEVRLQTRAQEWELIRFRDFVAKASLRIEMARVRAIVGGNLSAHREMEDSTQLCVAALRRHAHHRLIGLYTADVASLATRDTLKRRLADVLTSNLELMATAGQRLKDEVRVPLKHVRDEIATQQFGHFFPEVASKRWAASESLLLDLDRQARVPTLEELLTLPGIGRADAKSARIAWLAETEKRLTDGARGLINEGLTAWHMQRRLVEEIKPVIGETLRNRRAERSMAEWQDYFIAAATSDWRRARPRVWSENAPPPPQAAGKYEGLFERWRDEIRNNVRSHYEVAERQEDGPGESGGGGNHLSVGAGGGWGSGSGGGGGSASSGRDLCRELVDGLILEQKKREQRIGLLLLMLLFAALWLVFLLGKRKAERDLRNLA